MTKKKPTDPVLLRFLKEKLDLIKQEYAPTRVIAFGSRARGTAQPDSDVDIIVVSDRFRDVRYPNRMGEFLIRIRPGVHVDAICYTPEEFDRLVEKQAPLLRFAMRDGIQIV